MNIRQIIVREYLQSLTEKNELSYVFPILLESMNFQILTKPSENLGLQEHGKDVVAVGKDEDGVKKKFYFELKGGSNRNINRSNFFGEDGIHESIIESTYVEFESSYPGFKRLPKKVVIVHNGEVAGKVRKSFESFMVTMTEKNLDTDFDHWDISRLTDLFSEHLFGAYLITDPENTKVFNRVLVKLGTNSEVSEDFKNLIDSLLGKHIWNSYKKKLPRKWLLLFETLRLIGFVVYTEAKEYNNLEIAKSHLTYLVLRFWHWILKNKLEKDVHVFERFAKLFFLHFTVLSEHLNRTIEIAKMEMGLSSEKAGRYEQIGYTNRTFKYLETLCYVFRAGLAFDGKLDKETMGLTIEKVLNSNNVCTRPLLDIHGNSVITVLNMLVDLERIPSAKGYLRSVLRGIILRKERSGMLPDAANSIESVIKWTVTGSKPVHYIDSTSLMLGALFEYLVLLNMHDEFDQMKKFVLKEDIEVALFIPFQGSQKAPNQEIEDGSEELEEQLFSRSFDDGYQDSIHLKDFEEEFTFERFKSEFEKRREEFKYEYRTDAVGFSILKDLAFEYFETPYFPDKWRYRFSI